MKLRTRLFSLGLMVVLLANASGVPVYAGVEGVAESTQVANEDYVNEDVSPTFAGPAYETILYYINNYWPQIHQFLIRRSLNPNLMPLSERIRVLRELWDEFINSFKPCESCEYG